MRKVIISIVISVVGYLLLHTEIIIGTPIETAHSGYVDGVDSNGFYIQYDPLFKQRIGEKILTICVYNPLRVFPEDNLVLRFDI